MRSITLHKTCCIHIHLVQQLGLRITVVSFVDDIIRRRLSGLQSKVPDTRHKTQKSEDNVGGTFWAAPVGFPEVECTVAL